VANKSVFDDESLTACIKTIHNTGRVYAHYLADSYVKLHYLRVYHSVFSRNITR